jgi:glycosyltransferase involved in cell wall biosynthesis
MHASRRGDKGVSEDRDAYGEESPRHTSAELRRRRKRLVVSCPWPGVGRRRRGECRHGLMRVSFLIPAYDEARTIGEVLARIEALDLEREVIVVDDGSTDDTAAIVERWASQHDHVVLLGQENRGKGAAIRAAIPHATGEIIVIQDADMEYDPAEVPMLIEPIIRGAADVVFGSRLSGGRPQRAYLFWHRVGNRFLSLLTGVLFNTTLTDMETGYKAFDANVLRSLKLTRDDFTIEPELTGEVCRRHLRVFEMPIAYYGRSYAEGKKITWWDGLKAIRMLIQVRLRPPAKERTP